MNKHIKDIGVVSGKMLIFGGVYSNYQALLALKDICVKQNIPASHVICTGDIVAYCAQPEECVQLIKEWGIHCIIGNVEQQIREGQSDCACDFTAGSRCDNLSKDWYPYAYQAVSQDSIDYMNTLPDHIILEYAGKKAMVLHGSYNHISEFIFKSTSWNIKQQQFELLGVDVIFSGHCGLPFTDVQQDLHWLNAGVIGMPANDATTDVWYMTLDDTNGLNSRLHRMSYDHKVAAALMREQQLPEAYALTLETGIWDNCEILPDAETAQQGQRIALAD